jgi:hypothetical protein
VLKESQTNKGRAQITVNNRIAPIPLLFKRVERK